MRIIVNYNQIRYETERAFLIGLPHSAKSFWYPKSLSEQYGNRISLKLFDDMRVTIRDKTGEKTIKSTLLDNYFPVEDEESYLEVEEPKKLDMEVKIPDELRNDTTAEGSNGEVRKA